LGRTFGDKVYCTRDIPEDTQKSWWKFYACELWVFAMCPALRGSTVSYAGDAHFPKHSLEYSLNFWSQSKKNKKEVQGTPTPPPICVNRGLCRNRGRCSVRNFWRHQVWRFHCLVVHDNEVFSVIWGLGMVFPSTCCPCLACLMPLSAPCFTFRECFMNGAGGMVSFSGLAKGPGLWIVLTITGVESKSA
jgi:hypothetical protein